jgi:alkylation response protein AidB-like acyl-CoA dehydrogenase
MNGDGVEVQPVYTFMDERTNITYYDGVFVPDSYLLGEANGGARVMAASLELEHGGSWSTSQRHMLGEAEDYCRSTEAPNGGTLIENPAIAARLVRVRANAAVAELIQWRAIWASMAKLPNRGYGSMSKLFSSEAFRADSAELMDICAPASLRRDGPAAYINLSYRHSQGTTVYGGTSEVHRSVVAERALNLPRTRA